MLFVQNNAMMHHRTSKLGGSREAGNPDNHQPGILINLIILLNCSKI